MQAINEDVDTTTLVDNDYQSDGDDPDMDTKGIRFWTIWLSSGVILTLLFFLITYLTVAPKTTSHLEHSIRSVPNTSTKLSAFVIYINENQYNSEIIRGWKNLLQSWAVYSPCNAFSKPINWECSNVDLILYSFKNDLSVIRDDLWDYWLMSTERNRLCFRDFYIFDFNNNTYKSEVDYYFSIDFFSTPTVPNWLNKIAKILDQHMGFDFTGFYNGVGLYRAKVFPILQKPHLENRALKKIFRMTSNDQSTLFFNPND